MNANRICAIVIGLATVMSCQKNIESVDDFGQDILVSFESGSLSVNDPDTRITTSKDGSTYKTSWEAGDQISLIAFRKPTAGEHVASEYVLNLSDRRFTAQSSGASTQFQGYMPKKTSVPNDFQTGRIPLFCIYPATDLSIQETPYNDRGTYVHVITGANIPNVQDGTGWKYCFFASSGWNENTKSNYSFQYNTFPGGVTVPFTLSTCLVKFSISSGKAVKQVKIDYNASSLFVGDIKFFTRFVRPQSGGNTVSLTIKKDDDSNLPSDLAFACCSLAAGKKLTFTVTAADNSTYSKEITIPSGGCINKVYNFGTMTIGEWVTP